MPILGSFGAAAVRGFGFSGGKGPVSVDYLITGGGGGGAVEDHDEDEDNKGSAHGKGGSGAVVIRYQL